MPDAGQDENLEDVLDEGVQLSGAARQQRETRDEPFDHQRDHANCQDNESAEDENVEHAGVEIPEHATLREGVFEGPPNPLRYASEPVVGRPGHQNPNTAPRRPGEGEGREENQEAEQNTARNAENLPFGRERKHAGNFIGGIQPVSS